jgi:dihydropteroate synthase
MPVISASSAVRDAVERAVRQRGAALMGVLNVTPDSFFDGGRYLGGAARERVDALIAEGADLIDIGGESSRPGSEPVAQAVQIERIEPAVRYALERGALVSIDTTSPEVAARMLELGAQVINDVSCLSDVELARVVARHDGVLVLMHCRGPMSQMPGFSVYPDDAYGDVVRDVTTEWRAARDRATAAGLRPEAVYFDPGLGFGKNARHSYQLLSRLRELTHEGVAVVVGPSRKSFIAAGDKAPPEERLGGTIAACVLAVQRGAAVLRVHDVLPVRQALDVLRRGSEAGGAS